MLRHFFGILCLGLSLVLFLPAISLSNDFFYPTWQVGESWNVKAVYPHPVEKDQWSMPVLWTYRVEGLERGLSGDCLIIAVYRAEEEKEEPTLRLIYRSGDRRLMRAETTKILRGRKTLKILSYDGEYPVEAQQSPAPFDSPAFPLRIPSSLAFSVTKEMSGGLKKTETIRQEVQRVSGLEELKGLPEAYHPKNLIEVRCEDVDGKVLFSQYWDETLPWPVYGQNSSMKYWLVKP